MRVPSIVVIIYVVIGVIVAAQRDYFENLERVRGIISLVLAILLWPRLLLGVDLRIR